MEQHEKYDITQPIVLPAGMYHLNDNPSLNFQLNRLVNMDMGDLDKVRAVGFYRMAEFYMAIPAGMGSLVGTKAEYAFHRKRHHQLHRH